MIQIRIDVQFLNIFERSLPISQMSTKMSQVTCSLCNMKIDELKWQEFLVATSHLQNCGKIHIELTTKFFEMIFDIRPEIREKYKLVNEKTHDF